MMIRWPRPESKPQPIKMVAFNGGKVTVRGKDLDLGLTSFVGTLTVEINEMPLVLKANIIEGSIDGSFGQFEIVPT